MIVRAGTGWQTLMADLSIILFMVTAAALTQAGPGKSQGVQAAPSGRTPAPSPRGEPIAVYRSGDGAPPLGTWLDTQPRDPRQMLTLVSTYTPGKQSQALARAAAFAADAEVRKIQARVIIEPGAGDASATLAYDLSVAQSDQAPHGEVK
jgi:hypothetical protein